MSQPPSLPRANWRELLLWLAGRRRRYQVVEQSMLPTLKPGDTVLAAPVATMRPMTVGDIVIVRQPLGSDRLLIKRVKETFYDGGCYLISDNLAEPTAQDSRSFGVVAADQMVARVTSVLLAAQ
ncbi:MAG: S26 family signal peptidase [Cyanobacteria bacterium J06632_22]